MHLHDDRLCNNYIFNILMQKEVTEQELSQFISLLESLQRNATLSAPICKYPNKFLNRSYHLEGRFIETVFPAIKVVNHLNFRSINLDFALIIEIKFAKAATKETLKQSKLQK